MLKSAFQSTLGIESAAFRVIDYPIIYDGDISSKSIIKDVLCCTPEVEIKTLLLNV